MNRFFYISKNALKGTRAKAFAAGFVDGMMAPVRLYMPCKVQSVSSASTSSVGAWRSVSRHLKHGFEASIREHSGQYRDIAKAAERRVG